MGVGGLRSLAVGVAVIVAGPVAAQESGSEATTLPAAVPAAASEPASVPVPVSAPASASASASASVLLAPVQGSQALRVRDGGRILAAVRRALHEHRFQVVGTQELLGQAVVACQSPECIKQALDAAGAAFAIVPAIWSRESGGEELTLTLVQGSARNLNVRGIVGDDLPGVADALVNRLLVRRAATGAGTAAGAAAGTVTATTAASETGRRHAWKAGPILLIAGGAAAFVAIGVGAGVRNDDQQLNTAAVTAWAVVGAAAIGGGIAWWVVGEKRRQRKPKSAAALAPELGFYPSKIDLRLRF